MSILKKVRFAIEWSAVAAAAKVVPFLSRPMCHRLAQIGGALASHIDRHGRRVALANLEAVFGDELSATERARITRKSFQHFARTMIDLLWSPRLTRDNFREFIDIENIDFLHSETAKGKGVIFACTHYGNFEWMSHAAGFAGFRSVVLAQEFKNPWLEPIFKRLREVSGHTVIARKGGMGRVYKALRRGGCTALLVDLTVKAGSEAVPIECLDLKKSVTLAPAWLQQRTGGAIVPAHCEALAGGQYRLVFHPKIEIPTGSTYQEVAQACWDVFEPHIRSNPAPWLWMYKHWRYRPADAARPYPFYASFSRAFQEVLAQTAGVHEDSDLALETTSD